jgi:internalin A
VATFPSNHLANAIRDTLGLGPSDDIPCDALATIDSLQVVAGGFVVNSLAGMQNLTALEYFWAAGHNIPDLEALADLTQLTYLNVSDNEIVDITPVAGLTNLETLFLTGNLLIADAGPVAALTALKEVSFFNTNVGNTVSALSGATGLTRVIISYSEVTDISWVSALTNLEHFIASNDTITDVSALAGLTQLQTLILDRNPITDISMLSGLSNVVEFSLDYTGISDLTGLGGMTSLIDLDLQSNEISDITQLTGLTTIEELNLAGQVGTPLLTDISPLQGLVNLTNLQLHTNGALTDISPLIANTGIGSGDLVVLTFTNVSCADVMTLRMSGATVTLPGC